MASILVVEDEILIAETVREALRDIGHDVVTAASAPEAYAQLAREPRSFAAVVTDIDLGPGGGGFDVARQARALHPRIQVAYMTANTAHIGDVECDRSLLFPKPFDVRDLAEQIDLLIG